ncbi:MAG: hypothetical protein K2G45_04870 [Lachnospiraceae bacterium]|nr:hypothetical protein [Lachnospiraceae bacterium]
MKTSVLELPAWGWAIQPYTKHAFARLRRSGTKNCQFKGLPYKDSLDWQFKYRRLQTVLCMAV